MIKKEVNITARFKKELKTIQSQESQKIMDHVNWIAKQSDPSQISGTVECMDGKYRKIEFNDGWTFIYLIENEKIFFIMFYKRDLEPSYFSSKSESFNTNTDNEKTVKKFVYKKNSDNTVKIKPVG